MRFSAKTLTLAMVILALSQFASAQKREIKIEGVSSGQGAVPGEMVDAFLAGFSEQLGPPLPLERFDVVVTQDGVTRHAKVRSTKYGLANPNFWFSPPLPTSTTRPDVNEQLAQMRPYQLVTFAVPLDLHE